MNSNFNTIGNIIKISLNKNDKFKIEENLPLFLKYFLEFLNSILIHRNNIDFNTENLIFYCLEIINDCVNSTFFLLNQNSSVFGLITQYTLEIITITPQLKSNLDFSINLWKYSINLISKIFLPEDIESPSYPIFLIFHMNFENDIIKNEKLIFRKIKILFNY